MVRNIEWPKECSCWIEKRHGIDSYGFSVSYEIMNVDFNCGYHFKSIVRHKEGKK